MARFRAHQPPEGCTRFGYALKSRSRMVGVLLLIASRPPSYETAKVNVSSWFVVDEYRAYAPMLVLRGISRRGRTYVNVSPADHTRAIIETQGFHKASEGVFAGVPVLSRYQKRGQLRTTPHEWEASRTIDSAAFELLLWHHRVDCISVWCETDTGTYPFIFRQRRLRFANLKCAQLLYAPSRQALEWCGGLLGRFLIKQGIGLLLAGSDAALEGMPGRYFPTKMPIYAKGVVPPNPSDLTYTEAALFGF